MCLAKAFVNSWNEPPILEDIAHMKVNGDKVALETLLGEEKEITGNLVEIDFATSKILLKQGRAAGE
jgi:predicted RNA-binding protein